MIALQIAAMFFIVIFAGIGAALGIAVGIDGTRSKRIPRIVSYSMAAFPFIGIAVILAWLAS